MRLFEKKIQHVIGVLIFIFLLQQFGCAGTKNDGNGGTEYRDFQAKLDLASPHDFSVVSQRILDRYQYQIVRNNASNAELYIETEWKNRFPFDDEQGITAGRSRIILKARPKDFGGDGSRRIFRVRMYAESEVQMEMTSSYTRLPMSPKVTKYFKRIASDLRSEFQVELYR